MAIQKYTYFTFSGFPFETFTRCRMFHSDYATSHSCASEPSFRSLNDFAPRLLSVKILLKIMNKWFIVRIPVSVAKLEF